MKTTICGSLIINFLLSFSATCWAQAVAPPILDLPLERPKYLAVIQTENAAPLLGRISDLVKREGFNIDQVDAKDQQLMATRRDGPQSKSYDKVIIWLERDFQEPDKFVKIFFLYGRYMEVLGAEAGIHRVKIPYSVEEERIGKLRQSVSSLF